MKEQRVALALLLGAVVTFGLRPSHAATNDAALAETLYQAARELMDQGKYAEACPKFAESYRVAPATGTLLNLAACHEAQGKLASAWAEFMNASAGARRDGRADRVQFADERAQALVPKLSRLTVVAAPGADVATLEITLDGAVLGAATLGVAAPLDPGEHVIEAKSPGKQPFSTTVTLGAVADQQTVTVPVLAPLEGQAGTPPAAPPPAPEPPPAPPPPAERPAPIPTSVYVAGGTTLVLGAATVVTGLMYLNARSSYQSYRSSTAQSESDHGPDYDAAKTLGVTNVTLFAATLVGAGVTTYLYVTRPKTTLVTGSLSAKVGPGFSGLVASGEF